jgi:hypothetical protein
MNPFLEHAARLLDHQPTRSMEAGSLHLRAVRETGHELPFRTFMEAVRQRSDHFAIVPPDPVAGTTDGWDPRQRSLYEAAMEAAGMKEPLIVLTERLVSGEEDDRAGRASPVNVAGPPTPADVLGDVHDALTHLLHAADPDDPLYEAVTGAFEELHAARRALTNA